MGLYAIKHERISFRILIMSIFRYAKITKSLPFCSRLFYNKVYIFAEKFISKKFGEFIKKRLLNT